eukprot:1182314-Prorocentrum_minimum.AAC.2
MLAAEGRQAAGLTSEEGPLRLNCQDSTLSLMDEPQVGNQISHPRRQNILMGSGNGFRSLGWVGVATPRSDPQKCKPLPGA